MQLTSKKGIRYIRLSGRERAQLDAAKELLSELAALSPSYVSRFAEDASEGITNTLEALQGDPKAEAGEPIVNAPY